VKRSTSKKLRAELRQFFAEQPVMAIHEPALGELIGAVLNGYPINLGRMELSAKLSMASSDPTSTQMIGQVAVLPVFGVLQQKSNWMSRYLGWTATETLERDFKEAAGNSQVKAVVLYCDTPGGNAMGNEETSRVIAQARASKPIVTFVRGLCCSAGYYLGSAASKVYASPSSLIGSIGAVSTHLEYSKAFGGNGRSGRRDSQRAAQAALEPVRKAGPEGQGDAAEDGQRLRQPVRAGRRPLPRRQPGRRTGQIWAGGRVRRTGGQAAGAHRRRGVLGNAARRSCRRAARCPTSAATTGTTSRWRGNSFFGGLPAAGLAVQGLGELADSFAPAIAASSSSLELSVLSCQGSGSPAAVSAANLVSGQLPVVSGPTTSPEQSTVKISAKVRAALFARNLISAQDADESVCVAALNAYFAARGEACPQEDDKTSRRCLRSRRRRRLLRRLRRSIGADGKPAAQPNNVQAAHDREVAEAVRRRRKDEADAAKGNSGQRQAAQSRPGGDRRGDRGRQTVRRGRYGLAPASCANNEKPITPRADVKVGEEGASALRRRRRAGDDDPLRPRHHVPKEKITPQIEQLSRAPLHVHALKCLQAANIRVLTSTIARRFAKRRSKWTPAGK
jgi:ClpP class serine protease